MRRTSYWTECFLMLHASPVSAIRLSMPHLFLSFIKRPHTYTHRLPRSLWLEYISWWPRQVTDGDLTALLTVNWVLIKPKHVREMLIIHCKLSEAGVQPQEHCDYMHMRLRFIITFPIVIKPLGHYYPFMALQLRSMRQDGLGVSMSLDTPALKLYRSPK